MSGRADGPDVAVCTDADVIAAVHWATVTVAYRPYFPDSSPLAYASLRAIWVKRLADPTAVGLVASRYGRPVGAVMARGDPEFPGGQIVALHVLPALWGQGIGTALHDVALEVLGAARYRVAGLWVIDANERARRMYERRGWVLQAGITQVADGVTEVRYRRDLSEPRGSVGSGAKSDIVDGG